MNSENLSPFDRYLAAASPFLVENPETIAQENRAYEAGMTYQWQMFLAPYVSVLRGPVCDQETGEMHGPDAVLVVCDWTGGSDFAARRGYYEVKSDGSFACTVENSSEVFPAACELACRAWLYLHLSDLY